MELLNRVGALEKEADDFGFSWENTSQIMEQIQSECLEIKEHLDGFKGESNNSSLQEEIGDLLHAVFSLCVFCKLDPQDTLSQTLNKFERRLKRVKNLATDQGLENLKGHSFEELMLFWKQAKEMI